MTERNNTSDDAELAVRAIRLIDLTDLDDRTNADRVTDLCQRAQHHGTAAVCVWPDFVPTASGLLRRSLVQLATVVNFPTGDERPLAVRVVTERAINDGADEIDVVLPYRAWLAGDTDWAAEVLDGVRDAAGEHTMKVILETGELPDSTAIENASRFAIDHGADFIKTSTGKSPVSATLDAARAMLGVIKEAERQVGLKPSGGIRTFPDAMAYLDLAAEVMGSDWAQVETFRFGASGLLDALVAVASGDDSAASPSSNY